MACSTIVSEFTLKELRNCFNTYDTSEEILDYLATQLERVEATSSQNDMSTDLCQQFLHVLSEAFKCQTKSSKLIKVLSSIRDTKLLLFHTAKCLLELSAKNNQTELFQSLQCIINILDKILLHMPRSLPSNLGLLLVISDLEEIYIESGKKDSKWSEFQCIYNKAKILRNASILEISKPNDNKDDHDSYKAPPNNFREISILPCISDIFPTSELYLRPIIGKGTYQNLDHYLDVQFRLYREDCLHPLREGIAEYISQKASGKKEVHRLQDVRLYKNVRITNKEITLDGLVYCLKLDPYHSSQIRWESSKRLQYGSLVCLSSNDFTSLLFAIVIESDRKVLQNEGLLKVQFSSTFQIPLKTSTATFTMVESTSYFEAYRHVLASLQKIREGDLPFERYIVHCKTDILLPFYLRGENFSYDILPIVNNTNISLSKDTFQDRRLGYLRNRRQGIVDILNGEWPSAEDLHLDTSQYEAFKSALTKEFVIIQGPPGTGKTHVGLQIVKALLQNKELWSEQKRDERNKPLLIVCFTNHALDQFMEGILGFISNSESQNHIVRVGGQSKSPIIQKFTLKHKRSRYANYKTIYNKLKELQYDISLKKWRLRMSKEVVFGAILKDYVEDKYKHLFEPNNLEKRKILPLYDWLGVTVESWEASLQRHFKNLEQNQKIKDIATTDLTISEKVDFVEKSTPVIDVKTDADIIKDDRQIENEELLVETNFDEELGLDIEIQFNQILKSGFISQNITLIESLSMCANEAMEELKKEDRMLDHEVKRIHTSKIWKMPFVKRWKLYRYWLHKYKQDTEAAITLEEQNFKATVEDYKRERELEDKRILQQSTVIAITTTAAARYQDVLREVAPKIILVEEAAEVLEAHIVSTLSSGCEHLVLIGDHKQLRPKPAVFELAKKYNLSLSMFERMIKNGLSYHCLHRQHRMRPEISRMIKHIYPILQDNENVLEYDHVKGVKNDVFFINHNYKENNSDESRTYSNQYEAEFIPKLCTYLMKQGYEASQITVLSPYTGQMFCIRNLMPKLHFEGIRVSVLDNYQGEENDIIILSLVRNNASNIIGFLNEENRICVALSRAKKGLYILGNLGMLEKSSKLWNKVFQDLEKMKAIGEALPLFCQNHPNEKGILAKNPYDFEQAPDGGCSRKCDFRHPCGHACQSYCHPVDSKHINAFKCVKPCPLRCEKMHPCPRTCHYPDNCNCQVRILKQLPCDHEATIPCCKDPKLHECIVDVDVTYPKCKHETRMECWKSFKLDEFRCTEKVTVKHPDCEHDILIQCYKSEDTLLLRTVPCKATCSKLCENEHRCNKNCHYPSNCECPVQMIKHLPCGHEATIPCCKDPKLHKCNVEVEVTYPNCKHETKMECWKSFKLDEFRCTEEVTVKHPDCEHDILIQCYESEDTLLLRKVPCKATCSKLCENEHRCNKNCHYPSNCECPVQMIKHLPCGHEATIPCCKDPKLYKCNVEVEVTYPNCKHETKMECWKSFKLDEFRCTEEVTVKHPDCEHDILIQCYKSEDTLLLRTVPCKATCDKLCKNEHRCKKICHYPSKCNCLIKMTKSLRCGHNAVMLCYKDASTHKCEVIIPVTYPECKHEVIMECWKSDQLDVYRCKETVTVRHPKCQHDIQVECCNSKNSLFKRFKECKAICNKICDNGHQCKEICHFGTDCRCLKYVDKLIPHCGHTQTMQCFENPLRYKCRNVVTKEVPDCCHIQEMPCYLNPKLHLCKEIIEKHCSNNHSTHHECNTPQYEIDRRCEEPTEKQLPDCPHKIILPCNKSVNEYKCTETIDIKRPGCNHYVQVQCSDNPEKKFEIRTTYLPKKNGRGQLSLTKKEIKIRRYPKCKAKIEISCSNGHSREVLCCEQKESKCKEPCGKSFPCGHKCTGICMECEEKNQHNTCYSEVVKKCKAGHKNQVQCSQLTSFVCKVKCNALLVCGHKCSKNCDDCMEGMMHGQCGEKCNEKQICGHFCFQSPCGTCRPCNMKCYTKCGHDSCLKPCFDVCRPCKEECTWSCSHMRCTRPCFEPCDRELCTKPCQRRLRCGHKCLGYCGEPCPRLCQVCDKQQFQRIKRHLPRNSEVFVVILPDCGHEFNSVYIDSHIYDRNNDVNDNLSEWAKCPTCQEIIQWHPRYGNKIKKQRDMLMCVKLQFQHFQEFPLKAINDSLCYLKEFDAFYSRLYDTDDTSIENLMADVMPEVDGLLSNLEFIYSDRRISYQQKLDIRCCMITTAIVWILLVFLKDTQESNKSNEKLSEDDPHRPGHSWKETLEKIIESSDGFMEYIDGRLQFLRKATEHDLIVVQNIMAVGSTTQSSISTIGDIPLIDTSILGVHSRDWLVCRKGHIWSATSYNSKSCKNCGEDVVQAGGCNEPIETRSLNIIHSECLKEEKTTKFTNIPDKSQRGVCRQRQGIGGKGSEQENCRVRESQVNFDSDRIARGTLETNHYYNSNWKRRDNKLRVGNSNDNTAKWHDSTFDPKNKQKGKRRGKNKSTEQQSNEDSGAGGTEKSKEEHQHSQGRHDTGGEQQSLYQSGNTENIRHLSSRQRGRGRGRPKITDQHRNNDSLVGRSQKLTEDSRKGQGEYSPDEQHKSGKFDNSRNSSSGQRGRGTEFRGKGRGRGRGRGRGHHS